MKSYYSNFKIQSSIWELGFITIFYYCITFIIIFLIPCVLVSCAEVSMLSVSGQEYC